MCRMCNCHSYQQGHHEQGGEGGQAKGAKPA